MRPSSDMVVKGRRRGGVTAALDLSGILTPTKGSGLRPFARPLLSIELITDGLMQH